MKSSIGSQSRQRAASYREVITSRIFCCALGALICLLLVTPAIHAASSTRPVRQSADANTLLLLHFENSLNGAQGETPTRASGITFQTAMQGKGALFGNPNQVFYPSANNINALEGTIEFWIKPNWNGSNTTTRNMVMWGGGGGLLVQKDGANNLRIMLNRYGVFPGGEQGVVTNIGGWQAGQWHHVAFTYSNSQKVLRVFVDGSQQAENTFTGDMPAITDSVFQIGGEGQGGYVDSVVDELRTSNVARSPRAIAQDYLDGLTLSSLALEPDSLTILQSTTSTPQLSAVTNVGTISIPTAAATWTSSDASIASVDDAGVITGVKPGTTTITATVKTLHTNLTVTVTAPVKPPEFGPIDSFLATPASGSLHEIPVVIINYLPTKDGVNIDGEVSGWAGSVAGLKENITLFNKRVKFMLEEGSRYRGYKNSSAAPSLGYKIVAVISVYENIPRSNFEIPWNPGIYRPDYKQILTRFDARHYVEDLGVKEFWMWGYHHGDIEPVESDMASALTGDISNSERTSNDLPLYDRTYTLYNYNFGGDESNAVHNHGHQLESLLSYANARQDGNTALFLQKFVGADPVSGFMPGRCGDTHHPPNATSDYDYENYTPVNSDIEDWTPAGTGQKKPIDASVWGSLPYAWPTGLRPTYPTVDQWYIYWMQNMPGYGNIIRNNSDNMSNWWEFTADWDGSITRGLGLYIKTPTLSINDVAVTEGDGSTVNAVFTVKLSAATPNEVRVRYATVDGSAHASTASVPGDYNLKSGTLIFPANSTTLTRTITIVVNGDLRDEPREKFFVKLRSPLNATIAQTSPGVLDFGMGIINDNDQPPVASISNANVTEGNSGTVNAIFTVRLSKVSGKKVTVQYSTLDGTAVAPDDYVAKSGTLTFLPSQIEQQVIVAVKGDMVDEIDEKFLVNLSNPVNATVKSVEDTLTDRQGRCIITDDDTASLGSSTPSG